MASNLGEGLTPRVGARLRNLLVASQQKHSERMEEYLDLDEIAERQGVPFGTYSIYAVEDAAAGKISEKYGHRLLPTEWAAMAAICFVPISWQGDQPTELSDQTFLGQVELLKRTLCRFNLMPKTKALELI